MRLSQPLQRDGSASIFHRAVAVLCLLLLVFSIAHTIFGHAELPLGAPASPVHHLGATATDTPDACAVCVAMATAVVLLVFTIGIPRRAQPRPPLDFITSGPLTGWHHSLSCRPPPAL
jgi:hypothetical protein